MGNTPIVTIDATGAHRPSLATILNYFTAGAQAIWGADVYLDSDSQDGEYLGLFSAAIDDANAMAIQAYNAFSPSTAQGVGLSSVVKINGIARLVPSFSSADLVVVGQAGTQILNGLVSDENSNTWALPATVTIPNAGQILVTATCTTPGAIAAPALTINTIENTQPGWQTATNPQAATPGAPVEADATLRARQSISTMNASTAILQGIVGVIAALPGVARVKGYENEGNLPDANGIPGHCIAMVVDGGDAQTIAAAIKAMKGGCGTYGSVSKVVTDANGFPSNVAFFPVAEPQITWTIVIKALAGFTTDVELLIKNSVSTWTNNRGIGDGIQFTRAYGAAYLFNAVQAQTFEIQSIAVARDGQVPTPADILINFNEAPYCAPVNVTVIVSNP